MFSSAKRMFILAGLVALTGASLSAQKADDKELSVEESYLQESMEVMVIREQTRADSRDMKLVALDFIRDAIDSGRANEEVMRSLEYLALEGTINRTRDGGLGRVTNNFPDVRAKAVAYLGEIGTEEAKNAVVRVLLADNEPMVLTEAVKSLGKIQSEDNADTVAAISWIVTRFDVLNPDNALALAALDTFEKMAQSEGGLRDPAAVRTVMRIAEGNYIRPVQLRALNVLKNMRNGGSGDKNKEKSNSKASNTAGKGM